MLSIRFALAALPGTGLLLTGLLLAGGAGAQERSHLPAGVVELGSGCGVHGQLSALELDRGLRLGGSANLTLNGLLPQTVATLWTGWSTEYWQSTPLPFDLSGHGMPGCELLVAPQAPIGFATGGGRQVTGIGVPMSTVILGRHLGLQAVFHDSTANAAGLSWTHALEARIGPAPAPTRYVNSITQFGVTFQFANPVEAGRFVNGDWFVVGPVDVIGMSPPCTTQGGRVLHGAMINPAADSKDQGYDSAMYGPGNVHHYLPSLNVALGVSASNPLQLRPDQSLIKAISNTDPNVIPDLKTCAVLTCVPTVPNHQSFRPPYAGDDHTVRFDVSMLDWSALSALQPAANMPVLATEAMQFERPWLDHCPGWPSRLMHPADNMPDYGRDFAAAYNQASLLCNLALPQQDRELLVIRLVQIGLDFWGNVQAGGYWEGVGGHGSGRKWPILFAGRLLQDSAMLGVGQTHRTFRNLDGTYEVHFGEDAQTFYVQETAPNVFNWGHGGYSRQHVGLPEFGFSHVHRPQADNHSWGHDPYRRCCTANAWIGGVLCVHVMGLVQEWNHPALFDYMDRFAVTEPQGWTRQWAPWTGRMWDLHRSSY
ncbi:MAG: hypothetical protein NXI31_10600 [bacterium]|nr:hypothetical protein [bacterium]